MENCQNEDTMREITLEQLLSDRKAAMREEVQRLELPKNKDRRGLSAFFEAREVQSEDIHTVETFGVRITCQQTLRMCKAMATSIENSPISPPLIAIVPYTSRHIVIAFRKRPAEYHRQDARIIQDEKPPMSGILSDISHKILSMLVLPECCLSYSIKGFLVDPTIVMPSVCRAL